MKRFLIVFVIAILLSACGSQGSGPEAGGPDLSFTGVDGSTVRLSDFRDQVILVEFWVTWCGSCRMMVPVLSRLHGEYSKKGLVILGVSLDDEGLKVLKPFVREFDIPYRVLLGDQGTLGALGEVTGFPTLFVIDREGRLARKLKGFHSFEELEEKVKRYL